jgi:phosphoribosylaminoimidazole-succinocarboxamide synthase
VDGKPWNKTAPAPKVPAAVCNETSARYGEALSRLTGELP